MDPISAWTVSITFGATSDSKTITMLNLITIIWLDRVSPKLVNMIKVKNGAKLRDQELYALWPHAGASQEPKLAALMLTASWLRLAKASVEDKKREA